MKNKISSKINESAEFIKKYSNEVNSINLKDLIITLMGTIKVGELALEDMRNETKAEAVNDRLNYFVKANH